MRTVDPLKWSRNVKKPPINVTRPWRFRVNAVNALEIRLRQSFCDAMIELFRNCSVECVRSVLDDSNPKLVRWCYFILVVGMIVCCLLLTAWNMALFFNRPPLEVTLLPSQRTVQEVDFPAVALCSYNTISKSQLDRYAKYLYSLEKNSTYSMAHLKWNLLAFSGLIARSEGSFDKNFTTYLRAVARETNVTNIIYKLSPTCDSMLVRCSWHAERRSCDQLFAMRITDIGYCCVFNGRYSFHDRHNDPYRTTMTGEDYGLAVVAKEDADDFTYVRRTGYEVEMVLFDGKQYPLVRAGVIRTYPMQHNASVFVTLQASVQRASESLRYYSDAWRGCHMTSAEGRIEGSSWSQCVAECRRRAVLALCQCAPYTKPTVDSSTDIPCTLEHMWCLNKHREKLSFFYPGDNTHESLSEEQADSVQCLHCRPDCARVLYTATVATLPHQYLTGRPFFNKFVEGLSLVNSTVIRVYFSTEEQQLYLVETSLRFYEILSYISSQWVFIVGITVVSVMELIYHCTIRWYHHYTRRRTDLALPKLN